MSWQSALHCEPLFPRQRRASLAGSSWLQRRRQRRHPYGRRFGRLSAECAWQQLALCESQAQTESSSLREEVFSQSAELTSLRDALGKSEVASRELESSKQQLVAEAQTEASSLREEVRNQSAECTSLSPTLCRLLWPNRCICSQCSNTCERHWSRVCYVSLPCCLSLLVLVSVSHCVPSVHYFQGYGILL